MSESKIHSLITSKFRKEFDRGCVLSPLLFNIYGEWIIRKPTESWEGRAVIGERQISNLRYAEDITLMTKTEEQMANLLQRIERVSGEVGLKLNRSKSCLLKVDRAGVYPENPMYITDIQMKSEVIYSGTRISNKCDSMGEIKRRISIAKAVMMKLTKFWKDRNISKVTKIRLIHTLVFPIVMYGSETWTLNANSRKRIEAFEMSCWRRMLRIPWVARRTNESILEELQIQTRERLLSKIERHHKIFGHIIRQDGLEKLVIQGKVDGKRKITQQIYRSGRRTDRTLHI
jgi:hypothetical protein